MDQTLSIQLEAVHDWLMSDGALSHAAAIARKRRLDDVEPEALVNEAWIKAQQAFSRRAEPYPDLDGSEQIRRFTYRVLDNLAIDRARAVTRRSDALIPLVGEHQAPVPEEGFDQVEQHDLITRLIEQIPDVASQLPTCSGCAHDVVVSLALDICQSVLAGTDANFDALVYAGLRRVLGELDDGAPATAAERQRKSRCGRCARLLLEAAFNVTGVT